MGNKRIKAYWLVLLLVLMTVNMVLSVEPTQAHYINSAVWNTVVEAEENVVTSKFLSKVADAPLTILVGEMPMEEYLVEFNLDCSRDVTGSMTWGVDQAEYVDVFMSIGGTSLEPNAEIQLEMGEHDVTMRLIPTDQARNTVHDALDINVSVNWADSLQGKFRVTLPEVTEADLVGEPTEPEPSNPGADDPTTDPDDPTTGTDDPTTDPNDPTTGTDNPTTDPEEPGTGTDDPTTDTDNPTTDPEEPGTGTDDPTTGTDDPTTDSDLPSTGEAESVSYVLEEPVQINVSANSANSILAQGQARKTLAYQAGLHLEEPLLSVDQETTTVTETDPAEPGTDSTEPTPTDPVPTDPTPTEPANPNSGEEEKPQFRLETIDGFVKSEKIPVKLYLTEDITQAYLGMGQTSDTGITIFPFPEYTCYSLDNGESYYMLYTDKVNTIELIPGGSKEITVLLDLSRLELFDENELTLVVNGFAGETLAKSASTKTVLKEDAFCQIDNQFLTQGSLATITLNENWKNDTFDYKVQMLTGETAVDSEEETEGTEETTVPEYVDVDASFWSSLTVDEENYKITLQIKDVLPQAGTYRVLMNWSKDDVCFAEIQTTFFINYSVYIESSEPETSELELNEPESSEQEVPSSE